MNLPDASLLLVLSNLLYISVISTIAGFPEEKIKEYNTSQGDE